MKVVAISGWKRSGKDSAADHLVKNHHYHRVAFADPLKDRVSKEFDIPRSHCDDPQFKESPILHLPVSPKDKFSLELSKMLFKEFRTEEGHPPMDFFTDASGTFLGLSGRGKPEQLYWTPRSLCILKGSVNRSVRADYWVQTAIQEIQDINFLGTFKSPKFTNENFKGYVISDLRYKSEVDQLKQAFGKNLITVRINRFDSVNSTDSSENDLNDFKFDVTIDNKGTLEEFLNKVDEVVK